MIRTLTFWLLAITPCAVFAQNAGDYRSSGAGTVQVNLNTAANWQVYNAITHQWDPATLAPNTSVAGFAVTSKITISADDIWINNSNVVMPYSLIGINFTFEGTLGIFSGNIDFSNSSLDRQTFRQTGTVNYGSAFAGSTFQSLYLTATSGTFTPTFAGNLSVESDLVLTNTRLQAPNAGQQISVARNIDLNNNSFIEVTGNNGLLSITGTFNNAGSNGYIQLGRSAHVQKDATRNTNVLFPIGTSAGYLPITVGLGNNNKTLSVGVFTQPTSNGSASGTPFPNLSYMVNAMWNLNVSGTTNNANGSSILLEWPASLEGGGFKTLANNKLGISLNTAPGTSTTWSTANANQSNNSANSANRNGISFASGTTTAFGVTMRLIAMPVKTRDLTAKWLGENAQLAWTGVATTNQGYFEVERATAIEGPYTKAGTLSVSQVGEARYIFSDKTSTATTWYYRIRTVDENGKVDYTSAVRLTALQNQFRMESVYPQPAGDQCQVQWFSPIAGTVNMQLVNASGVTIKKATLNATKGTQRKQLDLTNCAKGIYYLTLTQENQTAQSMLIKL
ncbi:T9SS type A sorting domain-containing protein [Flavihumibacter petaseus]|uniref:Secretion system C-terminal sorting domain-containing protein n=1 Tax=Flavihumibacter petaseus NBRC 106054 TaxID=1220578 RepID=A0A0E9N699_9BACT|nr:T9SS type A sorting domain-containing protein [Flavihumibacter petaseus]GAO44860.1 hypothetical protein FPE01S_04_01030 [Flavihumibacter petaseus NBRC 106054]